MAQPPPHIARYLERRFPRPRVDPEWLLGCHEWLIGQPGANDSSQKFLTDVELQLLQSDLRDSMVGGTGLPENVTQSDHPQANTRLAGPPVLVEVAAMTEIAHSAYQLDQIRVAREERMRLGQTDEDGEGEGDLEVEGEGPMPKYPRGMLKFELSDGTTSLSAIEYRSLPEIVLGKTPLGLKILLKNPLIRHGIAFLEPDTVELLGHKTDDREILRPNDFRRGLRARMGLPDHDQPEANPQPRGSQAVAAPPVRSPLREISPPPDPSFNPIYNDDENLEPRRRKLPSTNATVVPTQTSSAPSASATLVASRNSATTSQYFSNPGSSPTTVSTGLYGLNLGLTTAQSSQAPVQDDYDDEEEAMFSHFDSAVFLEAPDTFGPDENAPPPPPPPTVTQSFNPKPTQSFPMALRSSSTRPSTRSQKVTPTTRALVPEDSIEIVSSTFSSGKDQKMTPATRSPVPESSIEIVSFTSTQAPARSQPQTQSRGKGKGKEKADSSDRQSSTGPIIDVSGDLDLDPLFLKDLDEVEALRYADPEFKRQQQEELDRFSRSRSSTSPVARVTASIHAMNGTRRGQRRPIKPLPKSRQSLQPSSQGSSLSLYSQPKEVIEIVSDSSNSSSPRTAPAKPLSEVMGVGDDDDIEFLGENEDSNDEEQYDKENMPVMTRHVRRKVANSRDSTLTGGIFGNVRKKGGGGSGDIIDLSD